MDTMLRQVRHTSSAHIHSYKRFLVYSVPTKSFATSHRPSTTAIHQHPTGHAIVEIEGVSSDVSALIHQYAHCAQTGTSLQTLMKTGRGEFLHKTFHREDLTHADHQATDKILIQVGCISISSNHWYFHIISIPSLILFTHRWLDSYDMNYPFV
jgi:hypothetical protein